MNGTLVNGKRVPTQVLVPGDKVTIGQAVLWLEKKNVAQESRTPPPAPSRTAADPSAQSNVATRRSLGAAQSAPVAAPVAVASGASPVPDYAFRVRGGGGAVKWVSIVAVLLALGVGGFMARGLLGSSGRAVVEDRDNLLGRNSTFDRNVGGKPEGWGFREKAASAVGVDPAQGRNGGSCMVLEKAAADLVAEIAYGEEFSLGSSSLIEAEAHARFENFAGWAAFKLDWLREPKGPVMAEEYSDPVTKCSAWTAIRQPFTPPAGARAFRVALVAIGRTGRVFFDDVSLKRQAGSGALAEQKLGAHGFRPSRQGVAQIVLKGRQALSNVGVRLESEKEGGIPQASALGVSLTPQQDLLIFTGRLLNPVDFREVEFEQQVASDQGATVAVWRFKGAEIRQVDRVTIQLGLPQIDSVQGLPETPDQPVLRVVCAASDGDFVIEANEPARFREQVVQGRRRLSLTFKVDPQQEEPAFGFSVRSAGAGASADPEQAGETAIAQRRYGEALSILRDFRQKIRDAAQRERVEEKIRRLEESEKRELEEIQGLAFQSLMSGRPEVRKRAQEAADAFLSQWMGSGGEGKAQKVREDLAAQAKTSAAAEAERPRRVLDQAKKCAEGGKPAVAAAMLRALLAKYPSNEVADEAKQLLGTLGQ
jgi:TolA-binding protein